MRSLQNAMPGLFQAISKLPRVLLLHTHQEQGQEDEGTQGTLASLPSLVFSSCLSKSYTHVLCPILQFLVPRQAAAAAGSNAKSPAAGQAAPQPATGFKRLQLVRPGAPSAAKKPATNLPEKSVKITNSGLQKVSLPKTTVSKVKQPKASLPRNLLPRPSPSLPAAQAPVAAAAPSGAPRRAFRIPTLPADALPSLSALFQLENNSISSFLACKFLSFYFLIFLLSTPL